MSLFSRAVLALLLLLGLAAGPAGAQQKPFVNDDLASNAVRLEAKLKTTYRAPGAPLDRVKRDAESAFSRSDWNLALDQYGRAIALDPKDWSLWNRYARAAATAYRESYSDRYTLRSDAAAAAYAAYLRAPVKPDEAAALATLGYAYQQDEAWRPSLNAYRASLAVAEVAQIRAIYQDLREKHGFRLADYKVDSDAASARACFEFTEDLARGKVDFSPYVVVSGVSNPAVSAEGQQLCVDGLEHGRRYGIVIRKGVPSAVGEDLLAAADYDIYVQDRSPQVRFTGKNYVLPRTGQEGLPIITVNTPKVGIEIFRIGDRNLMPTIRGNLFLDSLAQYQTRKIADDTGQRVWKGTLDSETELNKDMVTAFPVLEALKKIEAGVYIMSAAPYKGDKPEPAPRKPSADDDTEETDYDEDDYGARATQWFIVSDLGLTALKGSDGVQVVVRSLASAEPVADAEVRLVARNNEVLGTAVADRDGVARFDPGLARGAGGMQPGMVVVSDGKGDYGFLDLSGQAFDLTDRGVAGREAPAVLDAFVATERGVYRSGETVYVTALLRNAKGIAATGVPLTLVAKRPDGVEYRRQVVEDQGEGGRAWSLPLIAGLPTGTWTVEVFADPRRPPLNDVTFLLEDYVPDRIEVTLKAKAERLRAGEPFAVDLVARYLYGAPGAELDVAGEIGVDVTDDPGIPGLKGWAIGLDDEAFEKISQEIEEATTTDEKGEASVSVPVPEYNTTRPVQVKMALRVSESGGRAVERVVTAPILPKGSIVAVRKRFDDSALQEGSRAEFDVLFVTSDGEKRAKQGLAWELSKVTRRWQWYNSDGRWDYEAIKSTRRIADGRVDVGGADPGRISFPVEWGTYRLDVRDSGGAHTALTFSVGWGGADKVDTPDVLDVKLDKTSYLTGEALKVRLTPRFDGKATVMVVSDKVEAIRTVDVSREGTTVEIPVASAWGAGAYLVALAHRPLDVAAHRMPGRAIGLAWFEIDRDVRRIGVELQASDLVRPRGTLTIPVKLAGLSPGDSAHVVVSAVDVGILNLTQYKTPDPDGFYFGQRQLGTELRDLYGYLIDGMQGTRGRIQTGGDGGGEGDAAVPREAPLARYSGVVRVGPDGTATVAFDLPAFNGTVRLAAMAWTADKVGHAEKDVIVRDPVVVQATLPRFLNLGDRTRFHMAVDNVEAPAGEYVVDLDLHGPIVVPAEALRSRVTLAKGGRTEIALPVTAAGIGTAVVDVRLTGQGLDLTQTLIVKVQPGTPALTRRTVRPLAGGASVTLTSDVLADFVSGTGALSVTVAPITAFDVPALLKALDRYPYGCTEQVVSRAMPLLYANKLASEEQLSLDDKIDARVREAIDKVLARQGTNGSFGLWSAGGEDDWLNAFATDFLTRAREKGFEVPKLAFDQALDRLRNFVANTTDPKPENAADLAYAAYVLARNGRPVIGDLRYLADTRMDVFQTPLARAQIAAALAMLGDRSRAQPIFDGAMDRLVATRASLAYRPDYGSTLRDGAGIITMMAENGFTQTAFLRAAAVIEEVRGKRTYTSTQEQSWMVLAAHAMLKDTDRLALTVNGQPHAGALYRTYRSLALDTKPVTIANAGQAAVQLVVTAQGNPIQPEPAISSGYTIERTYHDFDGNKIDPSKVKQTDRFVVVLKVTEDKAEDARLLLVDHLPAGFEIDNPKLVSSANNASFDWLEESVEPVHSEYRDDRFVAAFDRDTSQSAFFHVAYQVRAVAPGTYVHPPAVVEDMYRPDRYGRTAFGTVEVVPVKP